MALWSEDVEDQLISMIQERPPLYDITQKLYANRSVKAGLWREIEDKLVISEKELKKRWESLRTQYIRYKKLAPSGSSGAQRTGRQQWILDRLQFLESHTKRKETKFNLVTTEPSFASDSSSPLGNTTNTDTRTSTSEEQYLFKSEKRSCSPLGESSIFGLESSSIIDDPLQRTFSQASNQRPRKKRSRQSLNNSANDESSNLLRTIGRTLEKLAHQEEHNDAIAAYCKNFEHRMRTLPPHLLPHFQHEVDNCLYKYSVGPLNIKTED
ncbi:uncharacterized protein LOC124385086 [Silurus meridionalis]|uniref:MADF domain-containing protein n=1 Tax=Silurus meridionalis TaxID=175797 RepID=A0A8T0BP28_SILME|nr:uncharacterized protein LOC124385086 [Silurus meridionalis]KAF7708774.1 hypothetical protein HF521_017831 [Silurus meridionalis]KAI5106396.1 transcription factor Adf-1-like isoform X3 [Silurus meridionalis]